MTVDDQIRTKLEHMTEFVLALTALRVKWEVRFGRYKRNNGDKPPYYTVICACAKSLCFGLLENMGEVRVVPSADDGLALWVCSLQDKCYTHDNRWRVVTYEELRMLGEEDYEYSAVIKSL